MSRAKMIGACLGATVLMIGAPTTAEVRYRQNQSRETVELSGLYNDSGCSSETLVGKVVKRKFTDDALTVSGIVVEGSDGTREFVNVEIPKDVDLFKRRIVFDGLQRLLREGRVIHSLIRRCGASGRFLWLEQVK